MSRSWSGFKTWKVENVLLGWSQIEFFFIFLRVLFKPRVWAPVYAGPFLCVLDPVLEGGSHSTLHKRTVRGANNNQQAHTHDPASLRNLQWEHDVAVQVEYDQEDKEPEHDPYSLPLVVREVAYSGKRRAIGPNISSFCHGPGPIFPLSVTVPGQPRYNQCLLFAGHGSSLS